MFPVTFLSASRLHPRRESVAIAGIGRAALFWSWENWIVIMPFISAEVRKQTEIAAAVAEVERISAPDVAYIRFNISEDWSGDPAVYFRVMLSDQAAQNRLLEVAELVESRLEDRLDYESMGLRAYCHYRRQSDQARIRDKEWA